MPSCVITITKNELNNNQEFAPSKDAFISMQIVECHFPWVFYFRAQFLYGDFPWEIVTNCFQLHVDFLGVIDYLVLRSLEILIHVK